MTFDYHLRIAGRRLEPAGRDCIEVENPATGQVLGLLPIVTTPELDEALESSARGFRLWRQTTAYDRAKVLRRTADLIRDRSDELAQKLTTEQGKAIAEARIEVLGAADTFEWYAEEGRRAYGRIVPGRQHDQRWLVTKEPVGPVAAFSPWNFPAMLSARKIAGALAAGCSCIIKPAEEAPTPALVFAQLLEEAGLPADVLNVVFGRPEQISSHLIASPVIRKVSFTGSVEVGKHLARLAADGMKKGTYELGGHAPVLVFDDADIDKAVSTALAFKTRNAGQMCISPTRFYVQQSIYERFTTAFTNAAKNVQVGNGLDERNDMGSLIHARRRDSVESMIEDARDRGAQVLTGGTRVGEQGYFLKLGVLSDVPETALAMNHEPFGPVALLNPFDTMDDAIEKANRLPFGLSSYVFTTSLQTARQAAERLEAGVVGVNNSMVSVAEAPFGGVKDSGYGSEAGAEGLEEFQVKKFISEM